ncbi:MAG: AgmX/PglI C-terminal domain-containing protein [Alphaproteobacteria bacterium]|nr:AgmX/PglI C-terminal domain-containing protein [Alphaproteobacteria bacterium]
METRLRLFLLVAAPFLLFVLVVNLLWEEPAPVEAPAPTPSRSPGVPMDPGDATVGDLDGPDPATANQRVLLPRSTPASLTTVGGEAAPDADGAGASAEGAGAAPPSGGQVDPDAIRAAVNDVMPDIRDCMNQWWAAEPELEGRVVMEFHLTPAGLGDVFVLEHDGVPFAVQTCFSAPIYDADWPRPASGELAVKYPFVFFNVEEVEGQPVGEPPDEPSEELVDTGS